MPYYGVFGTSNTTGWTTTSSTATNTYINPFFGATGGTYTSTTTSGAWTEQSLVAAYREQARIYNETFAQQNYANQMAQMRGREPTEEERAAEAARQRAYKAEQDARKSARERALGLLKEHLSPEQRKTFETNGWFVVEGGKSKTKYRIRNNTYQGNIDVLDKDGRRVTHRLCVHCASDLPLEDHLLSQKVMLEWDEDVIVKKANRHAA